MVTLTINDDEVTVPEGTSIMDAAKEAHIDIPHLCYLEGLEPYGACRVCVVEVDGERRLIPSCMREVSEGMVVHTHSGRVRRARRMLVELLLTNHPADCFTCERNQICELLKLSHELGVEVVRSDVEKPSYELDETGPSIIRDPNKCILCGRCIRVCHDVQTVSVIGFVNRGPDTMVATVLDEGLGNVECTNCGQCIHACPVGAIKEKSCVDEVWAAIDDPEKHVVHWAKNLD
jgi:NADH-quinone oxidoreductase subunit G